MTMAVNFDRPTHRCGQGCRHDPLPAPRTGGRCAFPDKRHTSGLCDEAAVALYVNPRATVRNTYRCARHDRDVVVEAAARDGFRRVALGARS